MKQLKRTSRPVLTVNASDIAALADAREGIRQGLEQSKGGQVRDAEEFFAAFEAAHGISS